MANFCGGTGRCGTSVLAEAVAMHPDVVYFQEPFWFCDRNRRVLAYLRGEATVDEFRRTMERSLRNLVAGFREQGEGALAELYAEPELPGWLGARATGEDRAADVRQYVEGLARVSGRRYWLEKTPHDVRNADRIVEVFPDARIVHMMRDPKDVFASFLEQDWGPKRLRKFTRWYVGVMEGAEAAAASVPSDRYMTIELETLVRRPHATIGRATRFFGIPYTPEWLRDAASGIDPRKAHVGRAEADLSPAARAAIDRECGPVYERWRRRANG